MVNYYYFNYNINNTNNKNNEFISKCNNSIYCNELIKLDTTSMTDKTILLKDAYSPDTLSNYWVDGEGNILLHYGISGFKWLKAGNETPENINQENTDLIFTLGDKHIYEHSIRDHKIYRFNSDGSKTHVLTLDLPYGSDSYIPYKLDNNYYFFDYNYYGISKIIKVWDVSSGLCNETVDFNLDVNFKYENIHPYYSISGGNKLYVFCSPNITDINELLFHHSISEILIFDISKKTLKSLIIENPKDYGLEFWSVSANDKEVIFNVRNTNGIYKQLSANENGITVLIDNLYVLYSVLFKK